MSPIVMNPRQTSAQLVRIANAIDASRSPDRRLVAKAIKQVIAAMGDMGEFSPTHVSEAYGKGMDKWEKIGDLLDSNEYQKLADLTMNIYGDLEMIDNYANWHVEHPEAEGFGKSKK